jgi:hypothetical protein
MIWAIIFFRLSRAVAVRKNLYHLQPPPYKLESYNFGSRSLLANLMYLILRITVAILGSRNKKKYSEFWNLTSSKGISKFH